MALQFLKGLPPKQPAWKVYGSLYYEDKLKNLVDEAFDAKRKAYNKLSKEERISRKVKEPKRVNSWSTIAKKAYMGESEEVKARVAEAVKARVSIKMFSEDSSMEEGNDITAPMLES